jgi:hypothetical protein
MNFLKPILRTKAYSKYMTLIPDIYLIKWNPKERSDIHNHDGKQCDFMILNGSLHECRFKTNKIGSLYQNQSLKPFQVYSINDKEGYHQLYNFDDSIKYSIHRYK